MRVANGLKRKQEQERVEGGAKLDPGGIKEDVYGGPETSSTGTGCGSKAGREE